MLSGQNLKKIIQEISAKILRLNSIIKNGNKIHSRENQNNKQNLERDFIELNELSKKLEEKVYFDFSLFKSIIENIPVAVFLKDSEENFKVILWNKAAEDIFEIKSNYILGKNAHDLWPKEQADLYLEADKKVLSDEKLIDIPQEPSQTKSRGTIYLHTKKLPIRLGNEKKFRYLMCISEDITNELNSKKALDQEKIKTLQASKMASLGEISAGIAHEINNPIAIISGAIANLSKFANDPKKYQLTIDKICRAVDRVNKIVGGLKKFSRMSEAAVHKPIVLSKIINESCVMLESKTKKYDVAVEIKCSTDEAIVCDEVEIEQVLINLINNAIDAIKNLNTRWIKIILYKDGKDIVLQIVDSGSGVSPQVENQMFQPFFTTKPVGEGTGLGLSIAKGILDEHHASISINRETPHTCFEIRFKALSKEVNGIRNAA